jgi:hypothetical protein
VCDRTPCVEHPRGCRPRSLTLPLRRLSPTELHGPGTAALSHSDQSHPIRVAPPWPLDTAPPFLTYSGRGGLPQDPQCGAESCPRSQEVAEGGGLQSAGSVVDLRVSRGRRTDGRTRGTAAGTRRRGRLWALPVPQPIDLIVLSLIVLGRRLRTACLGAVRPTSCDRQIVASVH